MIEFIKSNLFNKNGRLEKQRLNRRWFELRQLETEFDKYEDILMSDEKLFDILIDNDLLTHKSKRTQ